MKKTITQITVLSVIANCGFAQDFYTVKRGDTLSEIVRASYPGDALYGRRGKLAEVLQYNPHIQNPHRIFPGQKIQLTPLIETAQAPAQMTVPEPKEVKVNGREVSELESTEEWNVSVLYGMKYLSVSQSGALGKAEVGELFLNDLRLNSEYLFEDWSFGLQIESYKFKYDSKNSGSSESISSVNLYGTYQWFLGGLNIEQNPLFRNNNSNVEMTKMTVVHLSLGAKKDIELPARKSTGLKLKGWLNYPISSVSSDADVEFNSLSGFGLRGQAELNRQILVRDGYSFHATWLTQLGVHKLSQEVKWGTSQGEVDSDIVDASTAVGVQVKF